VSGDQVIDIPDTPDTAACRGALEVASAYCSPALLNHSIRSYVWAAAYAKDSGLAFDAELLYVSAVLHDIGLVAAFDNHGLPFEEAGGHVAWVLTAGAGWPEQRRQRAADIIGKHMWTDVDVNEDVEGFLLERSTGVDISGRNCDDFTDEFCAAVLARYPRLSLASEFVACLQDQAIRKPHSSAAAVMRRGVANRLADHPLDRF
jgi:hypothetical protein